MNITADGFAHAKDECGWHYRAWFSFDEGEYRWSKRRFATADEANEWGKRVAERWSRLFGSDEGDDNV